MSVLKILHYPDKRLRLIAKPIQEIDRKIKTISMNMIDTMYQQEGIGLAANQINIQLQIIVIRKMTEKDNDLILINPKIIERQGSFSIEEGCLSIPEYRAFVLRSDYIKVQALNLYGKTIKIEARKIISVCIQHEIDHLNGKLFIDYLSQLKKDRIQKKFEKIKKRYNKNKLDYKE